MSSFTTIKTNVRVNLDDLGVDSYSSDDIDDSIQDAYDDIVARTQCIIKKVTLDWLTDLSYYDFQTLIPAGDFLAVVAIYNNVNGLWLEDNINLKNLDEIQDDWELKVGTPENWAASNFKYTAIYPKYTDVTDKTFDLYYWAVAPTVANADTPLIATDFQHLLEKYSTPDLLEQYEEITSASNFWDLYYEHAEQYRDRVKNLAKSDLIIII